MQLVQILLPLYDNDGRPFSKTLFDHVRQELSDLFGGVTLYLRSPAVGMWERTPGEFSRDDVILVEVMMEDADADWWSDYRKKLEKRFRQERILVRATDVQVL